MITIYDQVCWISRWGSVITTSYWLAENEIDDQSGYLTSEFHGPDYLDGILRAKWMHARGKAFTCKAHYKVVKTFLRMVCENRVEQSAIHLEELERLQNGIY